MKQTDKDYARIIEVFWNVKNPRTKVRGVFGFLSTSRIMFAFSRTRVGSLRKHNSLSMKDSEIIRYVKKKHIVKDFGMVRVLVPLAPELSPYDLVEVVGNYMPIYHVKQPKHLDGRWLDLALSR